MHFNKRVTSLKQQMYASFSQTPPSLLPPYVLYGCLLKGFGYRFNHTLFIISLESNLLRFWENIFGSHHFSQISREIELDTSIFLSYSVLQCHVVIHWCVFVATYYYIFCTDTSFARECSKSVLPKALTVNFPVTSVQLWQNISNQQGILNMDFQSFHMPSRHLD